MACPAIEALHARFDTPISCDTWRASVLDAACAAGSAALDVEVRARNAASISSFSGAETVKRGGEKCCSDVPHVEKPSSSARTTSPP